MPSSPSDRVPDEPIRVVIGLGNPGREYEGTRHNVGFDIVDRLARAAAAEWTAEKKWKAEVARSSTAIFVKPQTYMNLSGRAVASVGGFFKVPPTAMLVVYDDVDLPLGQLRLRAEGSAGGHNGIKSLIASLGTQRFPRLKFGIGRKPDAGDPRRSMVGHVLGRFEADEREELEKSLAKAEDAVNCALARGLAAAMNEFNRKPEKPRRRPSSPPNPTNPSTPESPAAETTAPDEPESASES